MKQQNRFKFWDMNYGEGGELGFITKMIYEVQVSDAVLLVYYLSVKTIPSFQYL
jgi:hypothetical protein